MLYIYFYIENKLYNKYGDCFNLFHLKNKNIIFGLLDIMITLYFKEPLTRENINNKISIIKQHYNDNNIIFYYKLIDNTNTKENFVKPIQPNTIAYKFI